MRRLPGQEVQPIERTSGTEFYRWSPGQVRSDVKMPDEEWIKTIEDGRKVKFIYQELPKNGAFMTAQLAGNEVVYSVLLTDTRNPLSREDVERRFKSELSKK
jgi:hypothetical protein